MATLHEKRLASLSPRARKLYDRMVSGSRFYMAYEDKRTPKAMQELQDSGLVGIGGRVARIVSAFVPLRGFKNFRVESWTTPEDEKRRKQNKNRARLRKQGRTEHSVVMDAITGHKGIA